MDQNFNPEQLKKLLKKTELSDYNLSESELIKKLEEQYNKILQNQFDFEFYKVREFYLTKKLEQKLILRKLSDNLKKLYKDIQSDRGMIISQVITLLKENCPMWVLKTDVKSFYESIDRSRLIAKLKDDAMLSFHSLFLLNRLLEHPLLKQTEGVPRGINVSAFLSELYMRKFDKWAKRYKGVYYYARFVDDIIVFFYDKNIADSFEKEINKNLEKGLRKNESKTKIYDGNSISKEDPLEYLGYMFVTEDKKEKGKNEEREDVIVSIAEKKVKKIKSRITLAFLDYIKEKDYTLLENRMKFLTGNYSIRKREKGNDLKAGIHYSYSHLNDKTILDELYKYYKRILFSKKKSFGRKLSTVLTSEQRKKLLRFSYKYGWNKKVYNPFTPEEMKKIKSCWL